MIAPTFSTIPISYARDGAKALLNLRHTNEHDELIDYHITQGLKKMDAPSVLTKLNPFVDVCDNVAVLPCGYIELIAMRVTKCDFEIQPLNSQLFAYVNKPFFESCGIALTDGGVYSNSIQIEDGEIRFNIPQTIEQIQLAITAVATDKEGNRIIYERYQIALERYAASQMAASNPQMWTQNQYNIWHADYLAEKNQIKAQDVKAKFDLEKAQIGAIIRDWYYAKNPWLNG
jgi:hypothetical protein